MNKENPVSSRRWSLFPKALGREIEQIIKPVYREHGFSEHRILTEWPNVVGRELAAISAPLKLTFPKGKRENGMLQVAVASGARALELQHMQPMILERISTYFGYAAIAKVTFLQDASLRTPKKTSGKKRMAPKPAADALAEDVADEDLRRVLASLGAAIVSEHG